MLRGLQGHPGKIREAVFWTNSERQKRNVAAIYCVVKKRVGSESGRCLVFWVNFNKELGPLSWLSSWLIRSQMEEPLSQSAKGMHAWRIIPVTPPNNLKMEPQTKEIPNLESIRLQVPAVRVSGVFRKW